MKPCSSRNEHKDEGIACSSSEIYSDGRIGCNIEIKDLSIDISDLNSRIMHRLQTRKRAGAYKRLKDAVLQSPRPVEIKLNFIQRSRLYNIAKNLKYIQIARSLINRYSTLLVSVPNSKLTKSDQFDESKYSKQPAVHQFVPILAPRDATGNEVIVIRDMLRKLGYRSEVFVETLHPEMAGKSKMFTEYKVSSPEDVIIYHLATSSKLVDFILSLPVKKIIIYHNITPHEYFIGINEKAAESTKRAREQLFSLKNKIDLAIADSEFNKLELREVGFDKVVVAPIHLNFARYDTELKDDLIRRYAHSTNLLFVGRLAPNKKIEDLLQIFAYYNNCINKNSNLFIVGSNIGMEVYYVWLKKLAQRAKLRNVHFITNANTQELVTYYNLADVYVCMSEHEGFCIPLIESMYFGVPIVAYDCTAIPYTLGDAGIRVKEKNFKEIGELIDLVIDDNDLRNKIIEKQNERLDAIKQEITKDIIITCVQEVCG